MTIYANWNDYYNSIQDAYLDSDNGADEDVRIRIGNMTLGGQSNIGAYWIAKEDAVIMIAADATVDDVVALV